jgi:hypothetical protein
VILGEDCGEILKRRHTREVAQITLESGCEVRELTDV